MFEPSSRCRRSQGSNLAWRARAFRYRLRWLLPLAVVPVMMFAVTVASSHALMVKSEPESGQSLEQSPQQVVAWFSQELDSRLSSMRVVDDQGRQIDNGDGGIDLNDLSHLSMIVTLPADMPESTYKVLWTVVSAEDGDPSEGEFTFQVGQGAAVREPASQPAAEGSVSPLFLGAVVLAIVIVAAGVALAGLRRKASASP